MLLRVNPRHAPSVPGCDTAPASQVCVSAAEGPLGPGARDRGTVQVPSRRACGGLSISLTCCIGRITCLAVSHSHILLSISKRYFGGVITRHNGLVRPRAPGGMK